jgi:hypothetical protein
MIDTRRKVQRRLSVSAFRINTSPTLQKELNNLCETTLNSQRKRREVRFPGNVDFGSVTYQRANSVTVTVCGGEMQRRPMKTCETALKTMEKHSRVHSHRLRTGTEESRLGQNHSRRHSGVGFCGQSKDFITEKQTRKAETKLEEQWANIFGINGCMAFNQKKHDYNVTLHCTNVHDCVSLSIGNVAIGPTLNQQAHNSFHLIEHCMM